MHGFSFTGLFICQHFYLSAIHNYDTVKPPPTPQQPVGGHLP